MSTQTTSTFDFSPTLIGRAMAGDAVTPREIGSKAAQLRAMALLGLRVPPAFVLPTALCGPINAGEEGAISAIRAGLKTGIRHLERETGRIFGDIRAPLLLSVRSGAERSMPGMMETVLNVGMNDGAVQGLMRLYGDPRLAWDSYRRFLQGYGEVVAGVPAAGYESRLAIMMEEEGVASDAGLDSEACERLAHAYVAFAQASGHAVPVDTMEQLERTVLAVYRSWEAAKAREYRRMNHFEDLTGTAVTVQAMVFGNAGSDSGAGVAFSRDPATGAQGVYADFLFDAQGEDVVSGRRTPGDLALLEQRLPQVARELVEGILELEKSRQDMQDVEFTVENGVLYFLQTRAAKRTPRAALKVAVDLVSEGIIDEVQGLALIGDIDPEQVVLTRFAADGMTPLATGIAASPGTVAGRVAFDSEAASAMARGADPVILVRHDIATDDVAGIASAAGTLTAVGNRTAHAAVVARQLGRACVVGCGALTIDGETGAVRLAGEPLAQGDWLSMDGGSGEVFKGRRAVLTERPEAELATIGGWKSGRAA